MASSSQFLPKEAEVSRTLEKLKKEPINTNGMQDSILLPIYTLLLAVPPSDNDVLHWFCAKAKPVVVEAATFLLRLYAYTDNLRVEVWKAKLAGVLHGCCGCTQGFADAKISSRDTYFGAFSKSTLDTFFGTISNWEISTVISAINDAGVSPGSSKTLSDVPTAVLYHILTALPSFENNELLHIMQNHPPTFISSGWPVGVPPGLLLLLFHEKNEIRSWAQHQIVGCSPIPEDHFFGGYKTVLQSVTAALALGALDTSSKFSTTRKPNMPLHKFFTMPSSALWSGLRSFLRMLPPTLLKTKTPIALNFCRAIVGHLHDKGPHFPDVLRAFIYLVNQLGKSLWDGEDPDFPNVIFDSIKDNPGFMRLVQEVDVNTPQQPWFTEWFQAYLRSLWDLRNFGDVLKKVVRFMCEELQHERFKDKQPIMMMSILTTLQAILRSAKSDDQNRTHSAVSHVLDIHADIIVDVALSPKSKALPWHKARAAARHLLDTALSADASGAETTIFQLSNILQQSAFSSDSKQKYEPREPHFHKQIWKRIYDTISGDDDEGIMLLISLVARSAYLDQLSAHAFNPTSLPAEMRRSFGKIIGIVNAGLDVMRSGFLNAITKYTNSTSTSAVAVQALVRGPDMVKHVMALLLSPVDELQMAAQTLLGQAYDVDVRSDCFGALLQNFPVPSLDGLSAFIKEFNDCAPVFPEACSIAKSVVRCMADVIEVLANGHDGLLLHDRFGSDSASVRPHARLPNLWRLMCSAITVIFRRTPLWSKYFDSEVMVDWMRDALIFARDMLAQRRTIESAAVPIPQQSKVTMVSPRKLSQIGKQMLEDLQPVLTESIRWLRLTDMELLHQSSSLVLSLIDCFRETEVRPSQDALVKLEKFLDSARRKSSPVAQQTRLSETHLSELSAVLSFFNEDDDVQCLGIFKPLISDASATLDLAEKSKTSSSQGNRSLALGTQGKQHTFQHPPASSSKPRPLVEIQTVKGARSIPRTLITQGRSQTAAQDMLHASAINHHARKSDLPAKLSNKTLRTRPITKDERVYANVDSDASSSSCDESDDEDRAGGLASLAKLQKSPLKKKPAQRRTVKLLEPQLTGRNATLDRIRKREEAQRAALRMKPDLRPLHRTILSWNYDHDGPEPPAVGGRPIYAPILDQFETDRDYQSIFEPLLILECWNQLIKSKEEAIHQALMCKINSRQYIDDWLDLDVSVTDRPPDRWRLAETDIVLLRQSNGQKSVLAKVQSSRRMSLEIQATLRCLVNGNSADPGLLINTQWSLTRVYSLSTITREFAALKALPYYDFYADIMRPQPARVPHVPASQVQQAMKSHRVNEPQAVAILGSLQVEGFSLIQGPPGTGKTWTICGLVGAFLSSRSRPATVVQAGRNSGPSDKAPPKKVLVCAPSNAAIDEVAKRLKDGVRNSNGHVVVPNVVRVGADEAINISVKDVSLDQLVDHRLKTDPKSSSSSISASTSMASLRTEMDALKNARAVKLEEMTNLQDNMSRLQALEVELKTINYNRMTLSQQLNRFKDQQKSDSRTFDAARRRYRAEVLMEADIICATLSGAGHEVLENLEFEMVIIDEAAQSIELSSLIPLKYPSRRCIMVGDPQQLPPTVLSPLANKFGYGQSLFVRLQKSRPEAVHLLSIQYRMHPDISRLPSKLFYDQRLLDGPGMAEKTTQVWHAHPLFGSYKFVNVASGGEQSAHSGHSLVNHTECEVAVALYNRIKTEFPNVDLDFRIGVITMYRAQLVELKRKFQRSFGVDILGKVDFNTVDGFQGQEKDIIILSCVRAGPRVQSIGFLADQRRLNVAITRSRASLFILGHAATLERSDEMWKEIVRDARSTSRLLNADPSTYRRPTTVATSPRVAAKPASTRQQPMPMPSNLRTPKGMVQAKSTFPAAGSSSAVVAVGNDAKMGLGHGQLGTSRLDATACSSIPQKRRNPDHDGDKRLAAAVHTGGDSQEQAPPKPPPRPPAVRKRPKEVSMFIPKKPPGLKRAAPDADGPHDAKRRLTDKYFG